MTPLTLPLTFLKMRTMLYCKESLHTTTCTSNESYRVEPDFVTFQVCTYSRHIHAPEASPTAAPCNSKISSVPHVISRQKRLIQQNWFGDKNFLSMFEYPSISSQDQALVYNTSVHNYPWVWDHERCLSLSKCSQD